ncbi:MAG: hypothetical protein GY810_02965 [Aureispira sp.]|nr:hypothetical protein [Aureispira sp.]
MKRRLIALAKKVGIFIVNNYKLIFLVGIAIFHSYLSIVFVGIATIGYYSYFFFNLNKCKQTSNRFFQYMKEKNYQKLIDELIAPQALQNTSKKKWIDMFKNKSNQLGTLVEYNSNLFKIKLGKATYLRYITIWENRIFQDHLYIQKIEDQYKIISYSSNEFNFSQS